MKYKSVVLWILVTLYLIPTISVSAIEYTIADLGTLGGLRSHAWGINDLGQVVGEAQTENGEMHAFIWDSVNGMRDLGTMGTGESCAFDINNSGIVVGRYCNYPPQAFIWDSNNNMLQILPECSRSEAYSINDLGQVVGYYENQKLNECSAFMWSSKEGLQDFGNGSASGINSKGQTVGLSFEGDRPAILWDGDKITEICFGQAHAINDSGVIVGQEGISPHNAFVYDSINGLRIIGNTSQQSLAVGINNKNEVVGDALNLHPERNYNYDAFIWTEDNGLVLLDTLINYTNSNYTNWALCSANAINNSGQIVGSGWHDTMITNYENAHAFIMTPIPEPMTLSLLLLGSLPFLRRHK